MDRAKQREIASKGGKAAHQKGTAHEWTSEEAREAGRKGGMVSHRRRSEMTGSQGDENAQNLNHLTCPRATTVQRADSVIARHPRSSSFQRPGACLRRAASSYKSPSG
jgi:general stress protein YciG